VTEVRSTEQFVALGHAGSEHYAGLETFENPGVTRVEMTSDELTAVCPITGRLTSTPSRSTTARARFAWSRSR
jgi:hypothetical protein